ncbi:MAG: 2-oxo acid dehydrogenase subunit E2 [Candidatus Poribacteria bacterium]|nr:2-oxo acid dehydrogenase subunit E2 [Candidatus Poribacteria bacterium]
MAVQFRLAAFGHTMETGRVVEWHIAEGSRIEEGQPLVSIETDKTIVEVESPISGVVLRIVGEADGEYDVGDTLAWIGEEGEEVPDAPAAAPKTPAAAQPAESRATPVALRLAQRHGIDAEALAGTGPGGRVTKEDVQRAVDAGGAAPAKVPAEKPAATAEQSKTSAAERPSGSRVTPVAQRLAERHNIDAESLAGTGPGGRVTKEDVQRAINTGAASPTKPAEEKPTSDVEVVPLSGIRRTTAERLGEIWSQAPHVTEGIEVDFSAILSHRAVNEEAWRQSHGVAPTINDFVLKATAEALKLHPRLNATLIDGAVHQYREVNLGVAVDIPDGLVVPVIRGAETLGIVEIATQVRSLAERAREGKLRIDDYADGTFTVTNLGGLGVDWFTPVLNPPQCAILGVGRVRRVAVFAGESIVARDVGTLVLTFDHRAIDGAPCARFLGELKGLIEAPEGMMP